MHATYDGLTGTFGVVLARFRETCKHKGVLYAMYCISTLFTQVLMTPLYALTMGRRTFTFLGKEYRYFCHWYNTTFLNERAVEVAVAIDMLQEAHASGKSILEIGNVLSHYTNIPREVLDKYEKGAGVINTDIIDFHPKQQYDLIISVSTMEHVGFDERPKDPAKFVEAVHHVKTLLKPGGKLFVTFPVGYNNDAVRDTCGKHLFADVHFLKHTAWNAWEEVSEDIALKTPFGKPYQFGNAVLFCIQ